MPEAIRLTAEQSVIVSANLGLAWSATIAACGRKCLQPEDKEDALSAAFLALCRAAQGYRPDQGKWSVYAYRCALRAAQAELYFRPVIRPKKWHMVQARAGHPLVERAFRFRQVAGLRPEDVPRTIDPAAPIEEADEQEALRRAVDGLDDPCRAAVLEWAGGATYVAIGRRRGMTKEGARKMVLRALDRLRRHLA